MEVGHSRLLRFFKEGHKTPKMEEVPVFKIQKEYKNPENVESEVPGTQIIRENDENNTSDTNSSDIGSSEIKITGAEFTLSPVITVTKKETSLTKGDLKLQKVTVTEDISEEKLKNGGYKTSDELENLTLKDRRTDGSVISSEKSDTQNMEGQEKNQDEKKSKIPMLRLRQAVEKVKKEREAQKAREKPRRSSIPKLKDAKKVVKRDTSLKIEPRVDDEFDKLYEEIVDNKQKDIDDKLLAIPIDDPDKIETKFEEIIHAYDEDEHEKQTVTRISKIPALRRKDDERPSRIGAMIDRAKEKTTAPETKLKDGGFKVTASTIRTKRFSRGNSRDLSKEEHQIEVTETINIKESGDNEVVDKEANPERSTRSIGKHDKADFETIESTEDNAIRDITSENLEKVDGTVHKNKRFTRTISREMRERRLNRDLNKNLEDIRKAHSKKLLENSAITSLESESGNHVINRETNVTEHVQAKPAEVKKIIRAVSKEIKKDSENISNTETVTVENLEDGGTRTITTKTTVTETLNVGSPVVTEKIVRNISRELGNDSIERVVTTEETKDGGSKKITKEIVRENVTGIPVKTERFTRGISREMGNIKPKSNIQKANVEKEGPTIDNKNGIKKETMQTEQIEKEGNKIGIPVFTKVTRSFSKGKIHNVEMSRTIEWQPTDVVTTKNYSRSVSEKVTKKEFQDTDIKSFEKPKTIREDTEKLPVKSNVETDIQNNITSSQNKRPKDPVLEAKIKDTVKDIASKITTKKITEYTTEEQVTNVEKNTFTLSKTGGLNVDDLKLCREIGTQMSVENKTVDSTTVRDVIPSKEICSQMSIESKIVELASDRNVKESREIGTQMSTDYTKEVKENNSDKVINKESVNEQKEKEYSNLSTQKKDTEEVTILKGNVSRLKDKIAKENVSMSKKRNEEELPKKKSVLSKIAIFESLEPKEPYPGIELPTRRIKCKYVPPSGYQNDNEEETKIESEITKEQTQFDSLADRNKVKIGTNYDEVIYVDEPKIVKEYLKNEEGYGQNEITENTVIIQTEDAKTKFDQQQNTKEWENSKVLPATIDLKTEESEIEYTRILPAQIESNTNVNKVEDTTILPGITNYNPQGTTTQKDAVTSPDTAIIKNDDKQIDMPVIMPNRTDYEADIGKIKPGKINLNNWNSQVEKNKSSVDKIDVIRGENLQEIATTLPGKGNFKTNEGQNPISKNLSGTIDFKKEENQYHGADKIGFVSTEIQFETVESLPVQIEYKTDYIQREEGGNISNNNYIKSNEYVVGDVTAETQKINRESDKIETDTASKLENEFEKPEINQKKVGASKPKPGKINLDLWKDKVEANKTVVSKTNIKINKEVGTAKAFPGKVDFKSYDKQVKETQGNNVFHRREYKVEIAKTLPTQIDLSATSGHIDVGHIEQGKIDSSAADAQLDESISEIKVDVAQLLPAKAEFETYESKAEISETIQDNIYYSMTENQSDTNEASFEIEKDESNVGPTKSLPGKLNLKAWENQVEENKTLVDRIVLRSESREEIAKTLPTIIDIKTYEINQDDKQLNEKGNKDEIPAATDTKGAHNHPKIVDKSSEQIGNVKNEMYFITNKNSDPNSTDTLIGIYDLDVSNTENIDYEKKVDELQTKIYSINDLSKKTNKSEVSPSVDTTAEKKTKNYSYEDNIFEKEFENYNQRNIVQNELTRSTSAYVTEDFKTSTEDYKRTKSLIETTNQHTVNKIITTENQLNSNADQIQNETPKVPDDNTTKTFDSQTETNENEFNINTDKSQNALSRSAYAVEDFESSTEELKRAKSLAELDLGDAVHGQVRRMVGRIKSVDFSRRESIKTEINIKEMPKKLSVLEKIALFEGKASPARIQSTTIRTTTTKKPVMPVVSEEDYLKKIEELSSGKTKFGRLEKMDYWPLADGSQMPVLALGTALLDPRLIKYQIGAAIDMGYRAIDTAFIYGNEKEVGEAIKAKIDDGTVKREDLYIISKLWSTFHRPDLVEVACKASLQKMGLEYFDLFMIHNPMSFKEGSDPIPKIATVLQYSQYEYIDAWFGLEDLISKGLVKSIGVSNFNSQQIQKILDKGRLKPVVNQVECHPYLSQERLHDFCAERNITLSCFGVLGSKGTPAELKSSFTPVIDDALVKVIASGLGVTPAQLLIRYQIDRGHNVVVKASSAAHLWDNLQALNFNLDQLQINALHALNKNKRTFTFKGMGDTHKNYPFLTNY